MPRSRRSHLPNPNTFARSRMDRERKERSRNYQRRLEQKHVYKTPGGTVRKSARGIKLGMTLVQDAATREAVAAALNGGSQQGEGAGRAGNGDGLFGADDYLGYGADHLPNNEWPSSDDEDELQNHRQWSRLLEAFPTVDPALTPLAEKVSPKKQGTYFDKQREFYTAFEGLILYLARGMATGKMPDCSCRAGEDRPFKVYCIDILTCEERYVQRCRCEHWTVRLVLNGFFPSKPDAYGYITVISLDVLDLFICIGSHGSHSKAGMALGLREFHRRKLRMEVYSRYEELFRQVMPIYIRVLRVRDDLLYHVLNASFANSIDLAPCGSTLVTVPEGDTDPGNAAGFDTPEEGTNHLSTFRVPLRLGVGSLLTMCPACFFRLSSGDNDAICVGVDGNMQQCRYKHVSPASFGKYLTHLFYHVPERVRLAESKSVPSVTGTICEHNFKATAKPTSMEYRDETGLLMVVCRHDVPLRFLNLYAGERFGWVVYLLKHFLVDLRREIGDRDVILLYDIACQLEPHIRSGHPELLSQLRLCVNKFHGYAHEFRCQEVHGQHQTKGVGQSDGEGTERVWALLRILIAAGRISTTANRILFIENLCFAIARRKRLLMGNSLWLRYRRQCDDLEKCKGELAKIFQKHATDGISGPVLITEEMLREEQVKQREYFASNPPLMDETHMEIYRSLVEERRLESRNRELRSSLANEVGLDDPWNLQFRLHEFLIYEKCSDSHIANAKAKTEALLTAARQTRDQWKETDERWIAARDFEGPGREVYNLLLVEDARLKELEESISRMQANLDASMAAAVAELDAQVAMGVSGSALDVFQRAANEASRAAEMGVPLSAFRQQRSAAAAATTAVDVALEERGQTREMWEKGKVEWNKQFHYDQLGKLKEIYSRLLRTAASRTLEMRTVKAHSFGQKQAKALMGGIFKKRAGMAKDIDLFNKILEDIPSEHAPHKLKPDAFNGADDLTPGLHSERARDALFHLHVLRSDLLGTLDGPQSYWARSAYVRIGISQLLKRDRCEEELVMLKNEWRRNLCYTQDLLTGMATFVESDDPEQVPFRLAICKMLWDELEGSFVLIRAAGNMARRFGPDVFPLHGLESVVGRVRLLLEKTFHNFDDDGIVAWVAPGSHSTLPSDLKAEQVDAKREELFPTDGVPMGDFHAHDREVSDDDDEVAYEERMKTERAVSLEMLRVAERLEAVQINSSG